MIKSMPLFISIKIRMNILYLCLMKRKPTPIMYQRNYGVAMVINKRIRFVDIQFKGIL